MKIIADENIPLITVKELRAKGFDVADIRGSSEQGMPDEELWLKVQEEKRLLITEYRLYSINVDKFFLLSNVVKNVGCFQNTAG